MEPKRITPKQENEAIEHFTTILLNLGLPDRVSRTIAREAVLKAKKKLRPRGGRTALVTIEDSYKHDKRIRIFIKPGAKGTAETILSSFLKGKKGYPNAGKFQVEEAFGLVSLTKVYHCTLKPKVTHAKVIRSVEGEIQHAISQMTNEQRGDLIKNLKKSISAE